MTKDSKISHLKILHEANNHGKSSSNKQDMANEL